MPAVVPPSTRTAARTPSAATSRNASPTPSSSTLNDTVPTLPSTTPHVSAGVAQLAVDVGGLAIAELPEEVMGAGNKGKQARSAPATRSKARNAAPRGVDALAPIPGDTPEAPVIAALQGGRRKRKP